MLVLSSGHELVKGPAGAEDLAQGNIHLNAQGKDGRDGSVEDAAVRGTFTPTKYFWLARSDQPAHENLSNMPSQTHFTSSMCDTVWVWDVSVRSRKGEKEEFG